MDKKHVSKKGGMLITAIVGIDMRNTLDMDATIKGFNLEKDNFENILNEIFSIDLDDGVTFEFRNIKEIRQEDEYGGYRVSLDAKFDKLVVPMKLDITTGDVIIPKEVIKESDVLKEHWKNYQAKFSYAEDISYEDTMRVLEEIIKLLKIERKFL